MNFSEDGGVGIIYHPPSFSSIGSLTTEVYNWTGIAGKTHRLNLILSPYRIKGRVIRKTLIFIKKNTVLGFLLLLRYSV